MHLAHRDRRTLLLGVVTVVGILAVGRGVPALRRWESARLVDAAEIRALLSERESSLASVATLRDSVAARTSELATLRRQLISATSADAATAMLASRVEKLASGAGVEVLTTTLRPDSVARGGYARVAVRVSADGDVDGLADLLYAIESDARMLSVVELAISQPDPTAPQNRAEVLRIELTVSAVAQVVASAPRRKA